MGLQHICLTVLRVEIPEDIPKMLSKPGSEHVPVGERPGSACVVPTDTEF